MEIMKENFWMSESHFWRPSQEKLQQMQFLALQLWIETMTLQT